MSEVNLGRTCKSPLCDKELFAAKEASAKEYCNTRCRVIAYAIRELEKEKKDNAGEPS